jgi:hypothetical protein
MASPKMGRTVFEKVEEMKKEAARDIETLNPTDAERALGSYEAIVAARTADKEQTLARIGAV